MFFLRKIFKNQKKLAPYKSGQKRDGERGKENFKKSKIPITNINMYIKCLDDFRGRGQKISKS